MDFGIAMAFHTLELAEEFWMRGLRSRKLLQFTIELRNSLIIDPSGLPVSVIGIIASVVSRGRAV